MYKYIFIFLMFMLPSCSAGTIENTQTVEAVSSFRVFPAPHGFDIFYDSGATKTIKEYYTPGSIVVNGSYFGITEESKYYPAGYWKVENQIATLSGIVYGHDFALPFFDDDNITHFVCLSGSEVVIIENQSPGQLYKKYPTGFQAGPLVLSGSVIQDFGDSWHANGQHERTLMGVTESGKVYFFISTEKVSLTDIGKKIREQNIFKDDPITVLNLDGGPSTAYFDGKNGFREDAKLPIIFRIKP